LCFLVFAVPLGESFTGPLQDFTAAFLVRALQFSGIPAVLDGRMLTVPGGNWEVAEACSGLRYLVSTFTLGVLFAAMVFRTWRRRILFSALCLVTPIIANGIRAYGIVLLAYLTDRRVAVGVDHLIYGWVFFVLVICCLFFFGYRLREKDEIPQAAQLQSRAPGHSLRPLPLRNFALAGVLTLVACSAGPLYAFLSPAGRAKAQPRFLNPVIDSAWVPSTEHDDWMPLFQGTDEDLRSEYRMGDARVQLYVGYYATGESAARLVSSTNRILGTKWRFLNERLRSQVIDGLSMQILETEAAYNNSRHIVWSWYWIDGQVTANPYYAKYLQAKNRLLRRQGAAAVVALEAPYTVSAEEARASLAALLQHTRLSPTKAE
jgi:EpsI family protein